MIDSLSDVEVKAQLDEDVVGVGLEQTKMNNLKSKFEGLIKSFLQIQVNFEKAYKERSFFVT